MVTATTAIIMLVTRYELIAMKVFLKLILEVLIFTIVIIWPIAQAKRYDYKGI